MKYPIPEIPDDSEKKSGTDWVLPKIIVRRGVEEKRRRGEEKKRRRGEEEKRRREEEE